MRHGSEQQQPPYQQRHCEPRNPGFNNRENPQHDEQHRRRDIPSRDLPGHARWAPQTFRRTRRRHATPPRNSFSELAAIRGGPVSVGREHRDSISISSPRYQIFSASRPGNNSRLSLEPCASGGALQLLFFSASAALTPGGRDLILLMNAAAFQSFSSESHSPFANIPDRRTPCFATQKICASVYSVPLVGKCGTGGNNTPGYSSGFPGVPWHPAHSFKYTFPPAIKFSSLGGNGFGTSGASRRTEACTARRITALSIRDGGRSPRTSANPRSR